MALPDHFYYRLVRHIISFSRTSPTTTVSPKLVHLPNDDGHKCGCFAKKKNPGGNHCLCVTPAPENYILHKNEIRTMICF